MGLLVLGTACSGNGGATLDGGMGPSPGKARFEWTPELLYDCEEQEEVVEIRLQAYRRGCWDPELPCTLAQDPPAIDGPIVDCASASSAYVDVGQTGLYEIHARAYDAAGEYVTGRCVATGDDNRNPISNEDLDTARTFEVSWDGASSCFPD